MAELLSPGVVIEQVPSGAPVIEGVSTSNMAIVGYTERGPENDARLVTSFQQFLQTFGGYTRESRTALAVAQFFNNGGQRAYVVRVVPADATPADAKVLSDHTNVEAVAATGVALVSATALTTQLPVNGGDTPIRPNSVKMRWRAAAAALVSEQATERDGVTLLTASAGVRHYEGRVPLAELAELHPTLLRLVPGATTSITWLSATLTKTVTIGVPPAGSTVGTGTNGAGSTAQFDYRTGLFSLRIAPAETPDADPILVNCTPAVGDPGQAAAVSIGLAGGINQQIDIVSDTIGAAGNNYTVEVVDSTGGPDHALIVTWDGTNLVIDLAIAAGVIDAGPANLSSALVTAINFAAGADLTASNPGTGAVNFAAAEPLVFFTNGRDASAYFEIMDDGAGVLVDSIGEALTGTGTISYTTGAFSFTTHAAGVNLPNSIPYNTEPILADCTIEAWDMDPVSRGTWAHNLRISFSGDPESFDPFTATYARGNVTVEIYNAAILGYEVYERFEGISFTDPTDARYFPVYISQVSKLFSADTVGADELPLQLQGRNFTRVIAGGDESTGNKTITQAPDGNLENLRVGKRSVRITYISAVDSLEKVITDNGAGLLTGSVDPVGPNTINYTTGAFSVVTLDAIKSGTVVHLSYYQEPAATVTREQFGDTAKGYTLGTNGTFDATNYGRNQFTDISLEATPAGIYAIDPLDILCQLVVPDFVGDVQITKDLIDYANNREIKPEGPDRFLLLAGPEATQDAQDVVDWLKYEVNAFTKYGAFYAPWVNVADPLAAGRTLLFPPVGVMAGVYARTDATRNVAKTPAGTTDGQLRAITSLAKKYSKGQQDILTPAKINALLSTTLNGTVAWGARTLSIDANWKYITAVRTMMFLARTIYNNTQWAVFENNDATLRARITTQLNGFMGRLTADGYFASGIPSEAFRVQCDDKNNTTETIRAGQIITDVLFAPTVPAEFVRFRIAQLQV